MKLIPVIEIGYANQGIESPEQGPYWKYPTEWDDFNHKSYKKAGFKDSFKPFDPGASIYSIDLISDENLNKIVVDHTEELRKAEYDREQASPLFGGYVLEINGEKLFYPQCCGDLGDIQFWRNISNGKESFYEGHPAPIVKFDKDEIMFDLNVQEFEEEFTPIPKRRVFRIKKEELKKAINETELILEKFSNRIKAINQSENLNLERIEDLLVWENINY
ncbi:hypothetical protein BA195_13965 [Tenacibaculum soleae]|uniref:Uncharacterized protein n=1 Tax=Tenacibaculum soleae TaxID=447689 RepID=A0A1B9XYM7_9FLAO|nr:hypothetical protein [Tenacibaculum soleae]OCK42677.1 hypothetical protein BA195_13965 [Tenacibaculum soleae]